MTNLTKSLKNFSLVAISSLVISGCSLTTKAQDVNFTPPSADYRPAGIEAPFNNPANGMPVINPPLNSPMPMPIMNAGYNNSTANLITPDDDDDQQGFMPRHNQEPVIPNNPNLTPSNLIELQVTGTGVAPQNAISPAQSTALAKRAAMIDAYKLLGEKMYGVKLNGQDTVENMAITSTSVKSKVQALVRGADVTNVDCKSGLCQVTMELKLDGRVWYRALGGR